MNASFILCIQEWVMTEVGDWDHLEKVATGHYFSPALYYLRVVLVLAVVLAGC